MSQYKHILLATDLSDASSDLNKRAMVLMKQFGAKLSLIHTIEPIPAYGHPGFVDLETPILDKAKEEMAKLGGELGVDKADQIIEFGSVKAEVLNAADKLKVDLILIGSHGRHGFSRLLGSSASGIVHGADCDVLTVRCQTL